MIAVRDVEASSRWYQQLLGLRSDHGGPNYERLLALKHRYDPTNFFARNQNIKPTIKEGDPRLRQGERLKPSEAFAEDFSSKEQADCAYSQ